jgi:CRISPR-associated protein Cmr4
MTVPNNALLTSIYTLTPTHCGTGQAAGAVDLPIAREATTGLPILPSTSLKGVAREALAGFRRGGKRADDAAWIDWLFGPEITSPDSDNTTNPEQDATPSDKKKEPAEFGAGAVIIGEGILLAYPVRALNRPFLHITSPLLLERLDRICRAYDIGAPLPSWSNKRWKALTEQVNSNGGVALVADNSLSGATLVLDDMLFSAPSVRFEDGWSKLALDISRLLPASERFTRQRLLSGLILIPDSHLLDLVQRTTPIQARTRLTSGKTTDDYRNEEGKVEKDGNLWYEETLPADTLFGCVVATRIGARSGPNLSGKEAEATTKFEAKAATALQQIQIGGNETVGHGRCWWTMPTQSAAARQERINLLETEVGAK